MADVESENFPRMYVWIALSIFACVFIQIISYFISKLSKKQESETPEEIAESEDTKPVRNVAAKTESKASKPSKKRAWKGGKSEFTHPWLLKGLKGHTGAILDMDFSSNGKFLATSCEEPVAMDAVISPAAERARARKPRERRRAPTPPPPAPPAPSPRLPLPLLEAYLRLHLLPPERIWALGYPVECGASPLQAVFYIGRPPRTRAFTALDARAPSPGDSGRGSRGSSSRSDSDEEAAAPDAREHNCARCEARFRISADGEYLTRERCFYHWGRAGPDGAYACCGAYAGARGCETSRLHVWSGTHEGMNGPREGYVRARARRGGVLALDAEMVYTTGGLELASVAVVGPDGRIVYRATVRPQRPVIDCNTRFSGVRPRDIERATKTLRDVQSDILGFVGADTILVGHALDNDLRALRLIHGAVIDTSALFPHRRGLPWRRSLRALAAEQLGRSVQSGAHQPAEDAHTALDLVLARARSDLAVA